MRLQGNIRSSFLHTLPSYFAPFASSKDCAFNPLEASRSFRSVRKRGPYFDKGLGMPSISCKASVERRQRQNAHTPQIHPLLCKRQTGSQQSPASPLRSWKRPQPGSCCRQFSNPVQRTLNLLSSKPDLLKCVRTLFRVMGAGLVMRV